MGIFLHRMMSFESKGGRKRIFLVDDHPLVREWLGHLINQQIDLGVCGEAASATDAMREIRQCVPDAVVVDIALGGSSGIELITEIKLAFPKMAVLVLSMHEESTYVERALRAGALGYVVKRETTTKMFSTIRQVLRGEYFLSGPFGFGDNAQARGDACAGGDHLPRSVSAIANSRSLACWGADLKRDGWPRNSTLA
jgi:DNA-binding response OmpR family regulator